MFGWSKSCFKDCLKQSRMVKLDLLKHLEPVFVKTSNFFFNFKLLFSFCETHTNPTHFPLHTVGKKVQPVSKNCLGGKVDIK